VSNKIGESVNKDSLAVIRAEVEAKTQKLEDKVRERERQRDRDRGGHSRTSCLYQLGECVSKDSLLALI